MICSIVEITLSTNESKTYQKYVNCGFDSSEYEKDHLLDWPFSYEDERVVIRIESTSSDRDEILSEFKWWFSTLEDKIAEAKEEDN